MRNEVVVHTSKFVTGLVNGLLDEKQAAQYMSVSPGTLSVWRSTGRYGLPFLKVGSRVRYRVSDLDAWLATRLQANGATA